MYSVMLAAMLTTTTAAPDWGCYGCSGCHGSYGWSGCVGSCGCTGCRGYNAFSPACYGCCGGCYGCWGGVSYSRCYGGCCGGCYGCWGGVVYYGSCYGCCGGVATQGATSSSSGTAAPQTAGERQMQEQIRRLEEQLRRMQREKPGQEGVSTPAHLVVKLPQDARLFVDDAACPLTSATRAFDTPALRPGQTYYYTLKATVVRDGREMTESKRAVLRAGEETVVEFRDMELVQK